MRNSEEVFQEISEHFESFQTSHNGTTKKSKKEARKSIGEIKKLVTEYRKASVAESK